MPNRLVTQTCFLSETLKPINLGNKLPCYALLPGEKHVTSMPPCPRRTSLYIISLTVFSPQPPGEIWCSQCASSETDLYSDSTLVLTSSGFWTSQCVSPGLFFSYVCKGDNSSVYCIGMPTIMHGTLSAKFEKCRHICKVLPISVFFLLLHVYVPFQIPLLAYTSRECVCVCMFRGK